MADQDNGWSEYSRLVLKELETLASSIQALNTEIQELKQEITRMREREDRVDELRSWKDKIDDIVSPSQLETAIKEIENLKLFKTKAITIFAVIQFGMVAFAWALKVFG